MYQAHDPEAERLEILLLGEATIRIGDKPLIISRFGRVAALLGYLALRDGRAVSRDELAEALWPGRDQEASRHSLRQALVALRDLVACEDVIEATRTSVRLVSTSLTCDVQRFRQLARKPDEARLRELVELYQGPFLPGVDDEWALTARAELSGVFLSSLISLSDLHIEISARDALAYADLAVAEDPLHDGARARKIRALRRLGDEVAAAREYGSYEGKLQQELGMKPSRIVKDALEGASLEVTHVSRVDRGAASQDVRAVLRSLSQGPYPMESVRLAVAMVPHWVTNVMPNEGVERLQEVLAAVTPDTDEDLYYEAKLCLAELCYEKEDFARAFEEAVAILPRFETSFSPKLARIYRLMGRVKAITEDYESARELALRGLRIGRHFGSERDQLNLSHLLAVIHQYRHDLRRSWRASSRGAILARQLRDLDKLVRLLSCTAYAAQHCGHPEASRDASAEAKNIIPSLDEPIDFRHRFLEFIRLDELRGERRGCREGYAEAVEAARALGNKWVLGVALTYSGEFEVGGENPELALRFLDEALSLRRERGERLGTATTLRGVGCAKLLLSDYSGARSALRESATLYREVEDLPGLGTALLFLGEAERGLKNNEMAMRLAERAARTLRMASLEGLSSTIAGGASLLARAEALARDLARHD